MAARCWRAAPSRCGPLAALLLCSWALVAAAAGGAARPRCEHTCRLELRGGGSASPSAPVSASLSCSCSEAGCPPLAVAFDSRGIEEGTFAGVSARPVSLATHPELNRTTVRIRPLLYFRGDGSTLVRFERPVVRGVRLLVGAATDTNRFTILRFADVTATIVDGNFSDNEADAVVAVRNGSALDVLGLNAAGNRVAGAPWQPLVAAASSACACLPVAEAGALPSCLAAAGGVLNSVDSSVDATRLVCTSNSATARGGCISAFNSSVALRDATLENNTAASGGAVFSDTSNVTLVGCTVANNSAGQDGGGIHCVGCTLDLANVTLANNFANRYGGALWAHSNPTVNISRSRFFFNEAWTTGGALAWEAWADHITRKAVGAVSVQGSEFANNSALLRGGAIAALPDNNSTTLVPAALAPLVLRGNTFDNNFAANGATLYVGLLFNLSLTDNTDVWVNATNLQLVRSNLTVYDSGVVWRKRNCLRGERLPDPDPDTNEVPVCELCPPFSYSLGEGNVTGDCPPCPANGRCFGRAVIVSADGHWHGNCPTRNATCNYTLADVTRCPNMAACRHEPDVMRDSHPYRVNTRKAHASLGGQYEAQQCNGSAYSGPLCGSCAAGYGQTAPFTCKRCLTKRGNARGLDLAGISMLWVTYWLVQTAVLLTTVAASLPDSGNKDSNNKSSSKGGADCADCTVGIDKTAAAPPSSDSSALRNRPMQWTEVFKAVSIYQSYLMILLNLPVSWLPFGSHTGDGGGGGSHAGFVGFVLTIAGLVNGAPASLDCLMAAHGITWSPRNAAVFKALVNLAAIPLVHLASLLVLQLAWFFVGDAVTRTASAVGMWLWRWLRHGGRQPESAAPEPPTSPCEPPKLGPFMRVRAVVSLLVVMFKFYPSLVHVALRMFMCVRIGPTRLWIVDVAVACPLDDATGEGVEAYAVGIVALILVTAWPLAIAGLLWGGAHTRQLAAAGDFRTRFGFLYLGARVDPSKFGALRWPGHKRSDSVKPLLRVTRQGRTHVKLHVDWDRLDKVLRRHIVLAWDAAVDVQRFALVAISLAVMLHEYYQVLLLCLALGLYLMLVLVVRPFSAPAVHRLTVAMLACLWLSCLGILCAITPAGMENPLIKPVDELTEGQKADRRGQEVLRATVSWLLAVINGAVIAVAAVMLLVCLHRMCRPMWARLHAWLRRWIKKSRGGSAASERAVTNSRACCWC